MIIKLIKKEILKKMDLTLKKIKTIIRILKIIKINGSIKNAKKHKDKI